MALLFSTISFSLLFNAMVANEFSAQSDGYAIEKWDHYEDYKDHKDVDYDGCPDPAVIFPCTCVEQVYGMELICSQVDSSEILESIFLKPFPNDTFYRLSMNQNDVNSNISDLNYPIFNNKTFQRIEMRNINFVVSVNAFDDMTETLLSIYFEKTPFTSYIKDFSSFKVLSSIYIDYSDVSEFSVQSNTIEQIWVTNSKLMERSDNLSYHFGVMENFQKLHVGNNFLKKIPLTSIYTRLSQLYYNDNDIDYIETQTSAQSYLDDFDASSNKLSDFEEDSFKVAFGGEVYLHINEFTKLEQNKLENIFINASYVSLYDNPLECGCDIAWLILNQNYTQKLDGDESCADGTLFTNLNQTEFIDC